MLVALLVACGGVPFDVYGGGEVTVSFGAFDARGIEGDVVASGAPRDELSLDRCDRTEFSGSIGTYRDEPLTRHVEVCGAVGGTGLSDSGAPDEDIELAWYGDWLLGAELSDVGFSGAVDYAALAIYGADFDTYRVYGTWQVDEVAVEVDGLSGTLSGPMDFHRDDESGATDTWTQPVEVTFAFDESVHEVQRYTTSRPASPWW